MVEIIHYLTLLQIPIAFFIILAIVYMELNVRRKYKELEVSE